MLGFNLSYALISLLDLPRDLGIRTVSLDPVSRGSLHGRSVGDGRTLESVGEVAPVPTQVLAPKTVEAISRLIR